MTLSEADLLSSLDKALMTISSAGDTGDSTLNSTADELAASATTISSSVPLPTKIAAMKSIPDDWPRSHRSSFSSTSSSGITDATTSTSESRPEPISRASTISSGLSSGSSSGGIATPAAAAAVQRDPLTRIYPAPSATDKLDLDEMLARPPRKWTLGHYFHKSRTSAALDRLPPAAAAATAAVTSHDREKELEKAKKEMLAAKEELLRLSSGLR